VELINADTLAHARPLLVMYIAQFMYSLARNLINPFFPSYVASFGVSYAVVGVVLASFGVTRVFIEIPGGVLIDRLGVPLSYSGWVYRSSPICLEDLHNRWWN
jgi:MFS family permease